MHDGGKRYEEKENSKKIIKEHDDGC